MNKKILIVDDEEDLREMLRINLIKDGYSVIEAADGAQALELMKREPADLVVLDVMMPHLDGYEVCRRLRAEGHRIPIIFLTAKDSEFDEVLGLELGGDDYVKKPFSIKAFLTRIKTVFRRLEQIKEGGSTITHAGLRINTVNYEVYIDNVAVNLPRKEFELLAFLASHPDRVFQRAYLLDQVWKEDVFVIDRTIDVHIGRIRKKLKHYKDFIRTIVGVGYRFQTDEFLPVG